MSHLKQLLITAALVLLVVAGTFAAEPNADDHRLALPDQAAREKSNKVIQEISAHE